MNNPKHAIHFRRSWMFRSLGTAPKSCQRENCFPCVDPQIRMLVIHKTFSKFRVPPDQGERAKFIWASRVYFTRVRDENFRPRPYDKSLDCSKTFRAKFAGWGGTGESLNCRIGTNSWHSLDGSDSLCKSSRTCTGCSSESSLILDLVRETVKWVYINV